MQLPSDRVTAATPRQACWLSPRNEHLSQCGKTGCHSSPQHLLPLGELWRRLNLCLQTFPPPLIAAPFIHIRLLSLLTWWVSLNQAYHPPQVVFCIPRPLLSHQARGRLFICYHIYILKEGRLRINGTLLVRICFMLILCSEKAMAPHSSTIAWKIPWTEEPGKLQSMGSLRVGHNWATSLSSFTFMHWRRKWQPTPVFLPGESQGQGSLVGFHLWGRTESDMTKAT